MHEQDRPKKPAPHEVGMALDELSVAELEERIEVLEAEIGRLKQAIEAKNDSRSVADSVFKI